MTDTCIPRFTVALSTAAKLWSQPRFPSADRWVKRWHTYSVEFCLAERKKDVIYIFFRKVIRPGDDYVKQGRLKKTKIVFSSYI